MAQGAAVYENEAADDDALVLYVQHMQCNSPRVVLRRDSGAAVAPPRRRPRTTWVVLEPSPAPATRYSSTRPPPRSQPSVRSPLLDGASIPTAAALLLRRGPLLVAGAVVALGAYGPVGSAAGLGVMALPGCLYETPPPTPPCTPPAPSLSTACDPPTVGRGASAAALAAAPAHAAATAPAPVPSLRQWRYANYYDAPKARMALELTVLAFLRALKAKPNWVTKVADTTIICRWAAEAAAAVAVAADPPLVVHPRAGGVVTAAPYRTLRLAVLAAALTELRADAARARTAPADGAPAGVVAAWTADALIPDDEAAAVAVAAAGLAAAGPPDWHPGSGGTVQDLLHPSLYAYAAGVSWMRSAPAVLGEVPWRACLRSSLPGVAAPVERRRVARLSQLEYRRQCVGGWREAGRVHVRLDRHVPAAAQGAGRPPVATVHLSRVGGRQRVPRGHPLPLHRRPAPRSAGARLPGARGGAGADVAPLSARPLR